MLKNLKNQVNNKKKISNPGLLAISNNNGVKQPPLEIINEINGDVSKESFYESSSIANKMNKINENVDNKLQNDSATGINSNTVSNIRNNNIKIQEYNTSPENNQILNIDAEINNINDKKELNLNTNEDQKFSHNYGTTNNDFNKGSADFINNKKNAGILNNNLEGKELINEQANLNDNEVSDLYKSNNNSYQGMKNNQPSQTRNKRPQGAKEERWKNIKITSIISEKAILSNQEGIKFILKFLISIKIST